MSLSSKKRRRREAWEESQGGVFPDIYVADQHTCVWLSWAYHVAPFAVRVDIQLEVGRDELCTCEPCDSPWLYVDEHDHCLHDNYLDDAASQSRAETQFGAMTRVRLMEQFAAEIRANREAGLAGLRATATAAGLYGKRERRDCIEVTGTITA